MINKPIRLVLAKNIQKYRKLNKLTQSQLAEKTELSNTYIANIECGKTWVSDTTLEKIADALHLEIYNLFMDLDESKHENENFVDKMNYIDKKKEELIKSVDNFFDNFVDEYFNKFK